MPKVHCALGMVSVIKSQYIVFSAYLEGERMRL